MKDLRLYDTISSSYTSTRRADPRIARHIHAALSDARTVLNVGAGTGNDEPLDRQVIAVEPSTEMIGKRAPGLAPTARAAAEDLPFPALVSTPPWLCSQFTTGATGNRGSPRCAGSPPNKCSSCSSRP